MIISNVSLAPDSLTLTAGASSDDPLLTCNVTLNCYWDSCNDTLLTVTWFKDNEDITSSSDYIITDSSQNVSSNYGIQTLTSTLTISETDVAPTDAGEYSCSADLDTSSSVKANSVLVTVQSKLYSYTCFC